MTKCNKTKVQMHQSSNSNRIHKTQVHQANGAQINYKVHMSK